MEMDGDDTATLEQRAAAAVQVQDWDTAIEIGEQLLATEPNAQRAYLLADVFASAGRHADVVVTLVDQRLDEIEPSEIERRGLLYQRLNSLLILNLTDSLADDLAATARAILDFDEAPGPKERYKLAEVLMAANDLAGARAQLELIEPGAEGELQDSIAVATWAVDLLEGATSDINDDEMPQVRESIVLIAKLRGRDVVAVLRRAVDSGFAEAEAGRWALRTANTSIEVDRLELAEQLWWFVSEVSLDLMLEPSFVDAGLTLGEITGDDRFALFEGWKDRRPEEAPLVDLILALRLRDTGHDAEWGRFAQAAATANTADLTGLGLLGSAQAQMMLGDLPKTERTLEMLAEADPALTDHVGVRIMRVMMIGSGIGDVERAKEDLTALRGELPEYLATLAEAGIATAEKRLDDAEHL